VLARIEPRNPVPEYNLGLIRAQSRDTMDACAHWRRALALDPAFDAARDKLAACEEARGPVTDR
jgi:Tfp pilus assembly protein PilF